MLRPDATERADMADSLGLFANDSARQANRIAMIVQEESVMHLDDLLLRRCDWTGTHEQTLMIAERVCDMLNWDADRKQREMTRLRRVLESYTPPMCNSKTELTG